MQIKHLRRAVVLSSCLILGMLAFWISAIVVAAGNPTPSTTATSGMTIPVLTTTQVAGVRSVLHADKHLTALIAGHPYKISSAVPWTHNDLRPLGAVADLRFKPPVTLSGTWLALDWDCSESTAPPYGAILYRATVSQVDHLTIFVDLTHPRVAGISPNPGAQYLRGPSYSPYGRLRSDSCTKT